MERITITTKQGKVAGRVIARNELKLIAKPILEKWLYRGGGKWQQAYQAKFDEPQRQLIRSYHTRMCRWQLPTGYPIQVRMTEASYKTLLAAARFFAEIPGEPLLIEDTE